MQFRSSTGAAAAAIVASAALALPAQASMVVTLRDVAGGVSRSCDTALPVSPFNCGAGFTVVTPNTVSFSGYVGVLKVSGLRALSNAPGSPTEGTLVLRYDVLNTASLTRQLLVDVTALNYTLPLGPAMRSQSTTSVVRNTPAPSVFTEKAYLDPTNTGALAIDMACNITVAATGCGASKNWIRGGGAYSQRLLDAGLLGAGSAVSVSTRVVTKPL